MDESERGEDPHATDAEAEAEGRGPRGAPNRRALAAVAIPIAALVVAANLGNAFAPVLLPNPNDPSEPGNPLLLLALTPQVRNQVAVVNYVDPALFLLVGGLRLMVAGPLFFLLGRWYGDAAIHWAERRAPTAGQLLREFERFFQIARIPIVLISRHNLVCLLAGASGMSPITFGVLHVVGTFVRLGLIIAFGEAFSTPIDAVLGWIADYRPWVLAVTLVLGLGGIAHQLRKGGGELTQLRQLEHDLETTADASHDVPAERDERAGSDTDPISDN